MSTLLTKRTRKARLGREKALIITSTFPAEKTFSFYTGLDQPTGVYATSIFEFADKIRTVDSQSLLFHTARGDFSRWLNDVVQDGELARRLKKLEQQKLSENELRSRLIEMIEKRREELTNVLKA